MKLIDGKKLADEYLKRIRSIAPKEDKNIRYEDIPGKLRQLVTSPVIEPPGPPLPPLPRCKLTIDNMLADDGPPDSPLPLHSVITGHPLGGDDPHDKQTCNNKRHAFLAFMPKPERIGWDHDFQDLLDMARTRLNSCSCRKRFVFFFFPSALKYIQTKDGKDPTSEWKEKEHPDKCFYYSLATVDNPVEIKFEPRPLVQGEVDLDE